MKLSIVTSLYLSSPYLREFFRRCRTAAQQTAGNDFEILLVHDGSPDDSLEVALELRKQDNRVTVIDLSRNFGHHKAIMAGLRQAKGERVFLIDCDLEEPPEVLSDWWARLDRDPEVDVIYGVQTVRKGDWFERLSGGIFYRVVNALSKVKLPANMVVARLMSARYVKALGEYRDQEMYLFALMAAVGFNQKSAPVVKQSKGTSAYNFWKRFSLSLNAITSFSNYPLYAIFYFGLSLSGVAFLVVLGLVVNWFVFSGTGVTGWTSVVVSVWAMGGFVLTALGVIGIYLAKIFVETKPRPLTVIRKIYGK